MRSKTDKKVLLEKYKNYIQQNPDKLKEGYIIAEVSEELIPNIRVRHECGTEKLVNLSNYKRMAYGCKSPICSKNIRSKAQRYTKEQWLKRIEESNSEKKEEYKVINIIDNKLKIKHNICGTEFEVNIDNYIKDNFNCKNPECRFEYRSRTQKRTDIQLLAALEPLSEYQKQFDTKIVRQDSRIKVRATHRTCNHETIVDYHQFKKDRFCCHSQQCQQMRSSSFSSKEEREIFNYIRNLGFNVEKAPFGKYCPYELDIYIPELKIAFEYNRSILALYSRKREEKRISCLKD